MPAEMRSEDFIIRLDGRVVELFHLKSDYTERFHVDAFGVETKPHGDGGAKIRIGRMFKPGELYVGSGKTGMTLSAPEWTRFQGFFAQVKQAQSDGPEPW